MENARTNEIKKILEFFERVEQAHAKYSAGGLNPYSKRDFFRDIFLTSNFLSEIDFLTEKLNYIKIIDNAVEKIAGAKWNVEKVVETLRNIQSLIVSLDFDGSTLSDFRNQCRKYKEKLELFENLYDMSYGEKTLEEQKVTELKEKISELLQEIESFSWDTEVKMTIQRQLYAVKESIDRYNLFGKQALEKEINALFGGVVLEVNRAEGVSDEEKRFCKKVLEFVKSANAAVKFAENIAMYTPALLEILQK